MDLGSGTEYLGLHVKAVIFPSTGLQAGNISLILMKSKTAFNHRCGACTVASCYCFVARILTIHTVGSDAL